MPIVTLFYSPEQAGQIGYAVALIAIFSVVMVLRLDAYVLSQDARVLEQSARAALAVVSIQALLVTTTAISIQLLIEPFSISTPQLIVVLVTSWIVATSFVLTTLHSRNKDFSLIAASLVVKAGGTVVLRFIFGLVQPAVGLWVAESGARALQLVYLARRRPIAQRIDNEPRRIAWAAFFKDARPFILFSTSASLVSTANVQIGALLIPSLLNSSSAGLYFVTFQLVITPVSMISMSVSRVFSSEYMMLEGLQKLKLVYKTFIGLLAVGAIYVALGSVFVPLLSPVLPGEWVGVVDVVTSLIWCSIPILAVSPLTQIFNIHGEQKRLLFSEVIKLLIMVFTFWLAKATQVNDLVELVRLITLATWCGYLVQLVLLLSLAIKAIGHNINRGENA